MKETFTKTVRGFDVVADDKKQWNYGKILFAYYSIGKTQKGNLHLSPSVFSVSNH